MEEIKVKVRQRKYKSPMISEVFARASGSQSCLPLSATPFQPGDENHLGHSGEKGYKSKGGGKSQTCPHLKVDTNMLNPGLEKGNVAKPNLSPTGKIIPPGPGRSLWLLRV